MAGRSTRLGLSALIIALLTFIPCVTVEVEAKTKPVKKSSWFASASSNAPAQPGEYRVLSPCLHALMRSIITPVYVHALMAMAEEVADKDEFADLVTKRKVGSPWHICKLHICKLPWLNIGMCS